MAYLVKRNTDAIAFALAAAWNSFKKEAAAGLGSAKCHADISCTPVSSGELKAPTQTAEAIASPNATDLATSLVLVNEIKAVYNRVVADSRAHKVADATNVTSAAAATDLATAQTLANEIKADYEAHRASTTYHYVADSTNTIAAVDATDQGTLNTLLNELKTDINAHILLALATPSIRLDDI